MLILGIDTSGKNGSIALIRFDSGPQALNRKDREELPQSSQRAESETLELVPLDGGTFSAQLIPQISALLQKHGLTKDRISGFAAVSGPGSFTGLRVGLAAIKALAEILQKPIAAVSLLEAVALTAADSRVVAALDAGRGEIYTGIYDIKSGHATCVSEQLLTPAELIAEAAARQVVTPDAKLADTLGQSGVKVNVIPHPKADAIAQIGSTKIKAGETVTPEALDATYIRRSDAEIKFTSSSR